MIGSWLLLCLLANSALAQTTRLNSTVFRLDSLYSQLYDYGEFNGNVLVARKGKIIFQKSYGVADSLLARPLDATSVFYLASVSKQFTATAILLLAKEGKLSTQDKLATYIPELAFYPTITINELIHHTSGLPDYESLFDKEWEAGRVVTNADVINRLQAMKPAVVSGPNEKFDYSNTGYILLGSIVERVSGKPFGQFLDERLFKPLKMNHTALLQVHKGGPVDAAITKAYYEDADQRAYVKQYDGIYGPGRVYSTCGDLFRWDRALRKNTFLTEADKKLVFSSSPLKSGEETDYGFGWFLKKEPPYGNVAYHSGTWPGFLTYFERHLDNDNTIIILQNNDNRTGKQRLPAAETQRILYRLPLKKDFRLPDTLLQKYAGTYLNEKGQQANVSFKHHSLWVNGFDLTPESEAKFSVNGFRPPVSYTFTLNADGTVEKYRIEQLGQSVDRTYLRKK